MIRASSYRIPRSTRILNLSLTVLSPEIVMNLCSENHNPAIHVSLWGGED